MPAVFNQLKYKMALTKAVGCFAVSRVVLLPCCEVQTAAWLVGRRNKTGISQHTLFRAVVKLFYISPHRLTSRHTRQLKAVTSGDQSEVKRGCTLTQFTLALPDLASIDAYAAIQDEKSFPLKLSETEMPDSKEQYSYNLGLVAECSGQSKPLNNSESAMLSSWTSLPSHLTKAGKLAKRT